MNEITVYPSNNCPYCLMMTGFLKEKELPFKEINLQQDQVAASHLVKTTGQMGGPQTEVNGQWVIGFNLEKVMQLIK